MELRIISREIIKPSSPTPHHLKTHKLSLLDQLTPDIYTSFLLFYNDKTSSSISISTTTNISQCLKDSLSKTLTQYYPFAGRVKDDFSVDCDDSGVPFLEAQVAGSNSMFNVVKNPEINMLQQLLPFDTNKKCLSSNDVNLAVQLNHFDCGGVAIGLNFRHIVADAVASIGFINNWAKLAGGNNNITNEQTVVAVDCTDIFPPSRGISSYARRINEWQHSTEYVTKRFVFDDSKVAALRREISEKENQYRPTRFEAVAGLIWGAVIAMDRANRADFTSMASIPVNIRNRMNPQLPQDCIGNLYHPVTVIAANDDNNSGISLARNIHEATKMVNDDFLSQVYGGDGIAFVNQYKEAVEGILKGDGTNNITANLRLFGFTGGIGLPLYEPHFGLGKPIWSLGIVNLNNVAVLIDACDGKGVEAWVGLPVEDMPKFEQDPAILAYASSTPSRRSKI